MAERSEHGVRPLSARTIRSHVSTWRQERRIRGRIRRQVRTADPILVYSLEKTGTSALVASLDANTERGAIKAHSISEAGTNRRRRRYRAVDPDRIHRVLLNGEALRAEIGRDRDRRWDVICGVREPVARAVSAYFNDIDLRAPELSGAAGATGDLEPLDDRVRRLVSTYADEDWFVEDLATVTGIDVYDSSFPFDQGWQVYENDRFRVLLVRFEDLRRVGAAVVADTFDLGEPLEMLERNVGATSAAYRRFLDEVRFDTSLLARAYGTRQAQHFYSDDERNRFIDRWTG